MELWSKFVSKVCFWIIVAFACLNSLSSYGSMASARVSTAVQKANVRAFTFPGKVSVSSLVDNKPELVTSLFEFELDDLNEDETLHVAPATSTSGLKEFSIDLFSFTAKVNILQTAWMYRHQAAIPFFILYHAWKSFLA